MLREDDVSELRRLLWLGHGHNEYLYGDDGEMQCVACLRAGQAWDYKNCASTALVAAVTHNLERLGAVERERDEALAACAAMRAPLEEINKACGLSDVLREMLHEPDNGEQGSIAGRIHAVLALTHTTRRSSPAR